MPKVLTQLTVLENSQSSGTQAISINVSGLKPKTKHFFYCNGVDFGFNCVPRGGKMGADLISGADGTLHFTFYIYYKSGTFDITDDKQLQDLINNSASGSPPHTFTRTDTATIQLRQPVGTVLLSKVLKTTVKYLGVSTP